MLTRAQISASPRLRDTLWRKTIDAKVANQLTLLESLSDDHALLDAFRVQAKRTDPGREGNCARIYWEGLAARLGEERFRRCREEDGLNALLNYGYGVLLTRVLQKMLAIGLDPMYGVGHAVRERAAPLAYDLMEPFRPVFDRGVVAWVEDRAATGDRLVVDSGFKRAMLDLVHRREPAKDGPSLSLDHTLDRSIGSLREAFLTGKTTIYKPWIRRSSKWDG